MQINEDVHVEVSDSGTPVRFTWRGISYTVVSAPEPWLTRRAWWTESTSVSRGTTAGLLDVPVWRVDATPLSAAGAGMDGVFDIARFDSRIGWQLMNAWTDVLDDRLFA
jgi:hypothetical protein